MHLALLGKPRAGKSTLMDCLVAHAAETATGKGSNIRMRIGEAKVRDPRVDRLAVDFNSRATVYTTARFTDYQVPEGILEAGKPFPPALLNEYRGADAIAIVVRAFENAQVFQPEGIDPLRDARGVLEELIYNDYAVVQGRLERLAEELKRGRKENAAEQPLLERCRDFAESGRPLRLLELLPEEEAKLVTYALLSRKPALLVINTGEEGTYPNAEAIATWAAEQQMGVMPVRGQIEREIAQLDPSERGEFLEALGLEEPAVEAFVRHAYELLGYQQFFTAGEMEARAWTIRTGASAWEAAGAIHSDIQKHFIRAEVCAWADYVACGSLAAAKAAGKYRLEKKEYIVQEGDILYFRHSG